MKKESLTVLLIGFGRMGKRHARAYQALDCFDLVGLCGREHQRSDAEAAYPAAAFYLDAQIAIKETKADVVCIATHIDSHDALTRAAIDNGAHVFLEKPVARSITESKALLAYASDNDRKIVVGYVRKHDPLWRAFVARSRQLGSPAIIRFLIDQPSTGDEWQVHRSILKNSSLTFDCAVHYVDMMSQICTDKPVRVTARNVRLHQDPSLHGNYGHLSVEYADGSCGFFDSAWGPMVGGQPAAVITATGPLGSVSMVAADAKNGATASGMMLVYEPAMTDAPGSRESEVIHCELSNDSDGMDAFERQQQYLYDCISGDACMAEHYADVISSMTIVAAGDAAAANGTTVDL